jgi:hypothetical protein
LGCKIQQLPVGISRISDRSGSIFHPAFRLFPSRIDNADPPLSAQIELAELLRREEWQVRTAIRTRTVDGEAAWGTLSFKPATKSHNGHARHPMGRYG